MANRKNPRAALVARQATDLAVAAPQVVAHRLTRMAMAGANPSARDRREFTRMVSEKQTAFQQSWAAMGMQSMVASQALMQAWMCMWWTPWSTSTWNGGALASQASQWQNAMWGVVGKGLAPVHRTAVANAKRLARG
ncbi:polyhydroxyalkanoate granule-associated phasin [Delftia tsuruhatensis]